MAIPNSLAPPAPLQLGLSAAIQQVCATPFGVSQLATDCFRRIGELDAELGCMVHLDVDGAMVRAAELDALILNGADPLPLHGMPVIIKEIFSVTDMPDSSGSRLETPDLFTGEGSFVKQLREAGCVILGKSFSTEFAFAHFNTCRPMPLNPAIPDELRATGGSSSGSAAAVAAGYCGLAIGTDTGGSVRVPAALCGVVGFKPTAGVWPVDGIFPLSKTLDTPGIFTNTLEDTAYVFRALSGAHNYAGSVPENLRIGVPQEFFTDDLDAEVAAAFAAAQISINNAGYELVPLQFPAMSSVEHYFSADLPLELLTTLGCNRVKHNLDLLDPFTRRRLELVLQQNALPCGGGQFDQLAAAAEAVLRDAGVTCWIAPTVACAAALQSDLHNTDELVLWQSRASRNTRCINAMGMTAISLPLPTKQPVGLQIVAPGGAEAELLTLAAMLEPILRA
jgi:aspartyl-tRNA(Asn)/glutamyl-tRNA(Gln) amidotransferase subunit A